MTGARCSTWIADMDLLNAALCQIRRDLTVALRRVHDTLTPVIFFAIVVSLFPLAVMVLAKVIAHWLLTGLPLVLLSPLLALQLHLPEPAYGALLATLALGTPVLSLLGAVGAALTLGLRGGGVLVSTLVLPLYTPVLIFGAGAVAQAASGQSIEAHLSLLAAFLVMALTLTPVATATALRVSLD